MQLMGRCGLRVSEVSYPADKHLRWSEDGDIWLFEVRGKNTKGGDPKIRDAWMPEDVADDVHKYSRERGLVATDRWVDASTPSIRWWVKETAETVAQETGDERWLNVSSHDLRRSWATYHLAEPTEKRIGEAMAAKHLH